MPTDAGAGAPAAGAPAAPGPRRQARGRARVDAIVRAAADLIAAKGPGVLTHRAVAARAGVPPAATTYYFESLEQLVEAAGALLAREWAAGAIELAADTEAVQAARTPIEKAGLIVRAVLPPGDDTAIRGHYEHLVGAGRDGALARSYAAGRHRFDVALTDLLAALGCAQSAAVVIAVVDGAAVTALSEGRAVRPLAAALLLAVL